MTESNRCEYCNQHGTEQDPLIRFNRVCSGDNSNETLFKNQYTFHEKCKDLFCKKNNIYLTGFFNVEVAEKLNRCGIL